MNETFKTSYLSFIDGLKHADLTYDERNAVIKEVVTVLHKEELDGKQITDFVLAASVTTRDDQGKVNAQIVTSLNGFSEVVPRLVFELVYASEKSLPKQTLLAMLNHLARLQDEFAHQEEK